MKVQFTNEQLQILLENDSFRKELVDGLIHTMTFNPRTNSCYIKLLDGLKSDISRGLIRSQLEKDVQPKLSIDSKVEEIIEKLIKSIGKMIIKSLKENKE